MDEKTLNELLECSVCLDRLDTSSKVLPCQHTFCCRCLEEIVSSNSKNELRCPECRFLVEIPKISDLPSNLLLIRLLEGLKTSAGTSSINTSDEPSPVLSPVSVKNQSFSKKSGQSQPCAKALYNYEAREPGDLNFKKGDIVLLRKQVDENWYHGELGTQHGFFPATYVQVITQLPQQEIPRCTALYDFVIDDENEKDCLTFRKDEVLSVIRRIDEHWAEGKRGDRIGIFPISFVDLNDAAKWLINDQARQQQASVHYSQASTAGSVSHASSPAVQNNTVGSVSLATSPSVQNNTAGCVNLASNPAVQTPIAGCINHASKPVVQNSSTSDRAEPSSTNTRPQSTDSSNSNSTSSSIAAVASSTTTVGVLITTADSIQSYITASAAPGVTTTLATFPTSLTSSLAMHRNDSKQKRHSLTLVGHPHLSVCSATSAHRHSLELGDSRVILSDSEIPVAAATSGSVAECLPSNGAIYESTRSKPLAVSSSGIYKAMFNYKPLKEDEVELIKGRYYVVSEKCQDGWFKGTCLAKGVAGVFPGNYVQMVRIAASVQAGLSSAGTTTQVTNSPTAAPSTARGTNALLSRNHSFPKTSPYHLNPDGHTARHQEVVNHANVKAPTRTITNVTQALSRSSAGYSAQAQANHNVTNTTQSNGQQVTAGTSAASPSSDKSHICINLGATTHSPKSSRRHHHHKPTRHASLRTTVAVVARPAVEMPVNGLECLHNGAGGECGEELEVTAAQQPPQHSIWMVGSSQTSRSSNTHDYTTASPQPVPAVRSHKKERRGDKRSESLLKRLASAGIPLKGRKSRSPPPDVSHSRKKDHKHSSQQSCLYRSGSEGSLVEGAVAATVLQCSPAATTHSRRKPLEKFAKIKPLAREKYHCVTPYPAQSELELEMRMGDLVYVHKKREDGWYKGTLQRTGKTGLFPCSFVVKV